MSKIIWFVKERNNAKKLAEIKPYAIYHDMVHYFSKNKKPHTVFLDGSNVFTKSFLKQPVIEQIFSHTEYTQQNPQTMVLWHGIIYKALFDMYMKYTNAPFDSYYLSKEQFEHKSDRQKISIADYKKLPRKYRQLFTINKYTNTYVLNNYENDMQFVIKKSQKSDIEHLLTRARTLIPVVYHEPIPDMDIGGLKIFETPHIYDSSYRVSNEQLNAVKELHDIFEQISKITFPCAVSQKHTAIFDEYMKEHNQQDIVLQTYKAKRNAQKQMKHNMYLQSLNTKQKPERIAKSKSIKRILKKPNTYDVPFINTKEQYKIVNEIIQENLSRSLQAYTR